MKEIGLMAWKKPNMIWVQLIVDRFEIPSNIQRISLGFSCHYRYSFYNSYPVFFIGF